MELLMPKEIKITAPRPAPSFTPLFVARSTLTVEKGHQVERTGRSAIEP